LSRSPAQIHESIENTMKTLSLKTLAAAALSVLAAAAHADVRVEAPWVRATVPGQAASGAFMRLTSTAPVKLVAASSPVADATEVHEMSMADNVMRMRQVPAVELPAGKPVDLAPGGYHIMFMKLHAQLKDGDVVPLVLTFEDAQGKRTDVKVDAPVRPLTSAAPAGHAGHGMGHGAHK
jgi:copper(I)-binding protein